MTIDRRGFVWYLAVLPFLFWLRTHEPDQKPKPTLRSKREAHDSRIFGNEFGLFSQGEDGSVQRIR